MRNEVVTAVPKVLTGAKGWKHEGINTVQLDY